MIARMTGTLVSAGPSRLVRSAKVEIVDITDQGIFDAVVLRYGVRDDYNTEFAPQMFKESLAERLPRIAWGHDWREMVGQYIDYKDEAKRLILRGKLDLAMIDVFAPDGETVINRIPAVPMAHQAYAQLKSGTADQFSVGFIPTAWEDIRDEEGDMYRIFTKGRLDEVSIVLAGAVPGTELLSVRSGDRLRLNVREPLVSKEKVAALILQFHTGQIDLADALSTLKEMPAEDETTDDTQTPLGGAVGDGIADDEQQQQPVVETKPEGDDGTPVGDGDADDDGDISTLPVVDLTGESDGIDDDDLTDEMIAEALALVDL